MTGKQFVGAILASLVCWIAIIAFAAAFLPLGCHRPGLPPEPPYVEKAADSALPVTGVDRGSFCEPACTRLRQLGCHEGQPSPRSGNTCEARCRAMVASEYLDYPAECVASSPDRAALLRCPGMTCLGDVGM